VTDPQAPLTRRAAREVAQAGASTRETQSIFARHPRILLGVSLGLAFVVLGTAAVVAGISTGQSAVMTGPASVVDETAPRAVPETQPAATRLRTCSIKKLAGDDGLATLYASVVNDETGEVLFERKGDKPARTASVLKFFTGAAAVSVLGPDYEIATTVYEGSAPGSVVLVGRGDTTLSRLTAGESVYKGAPKLSTLANQVVAAYAAKYPGVPITQLIVDASYWNPKDNWEKSWDRSDQTNGYQAEVTALQVDGDRNDPTVQNSPRSADPVARAGTAFANALATAAGTVAPAVSSGTATSTTTLGEVKSQPVSKLVKQMVAKSDGALAETLARIVSIEMGLDGSSASLQQAIPGAIRSLGGELHDVTIIDGSGLSRKNAVSPTDMARFIGIVKDGSSDLGAVYKALAVAGESGGLTERFTNSGAKGHVTAKVGRISTSVTLAGVIDAADGTTLTFAFYAVGEGIPDTAKVAIDKLTTAVYKCGDNLANN